MDQFPALVVFRNLFGEKYTHQERNSGLYRYIISGREFSHALERSVIMIINEHNSMPYMKTLAVCLSKMISEGYREDFRVTDSGLEALQSGKEYLPQDIRIVNFYRFEGESDPDDNAILYVIETCDGTRGTLVDAYGTYHDGRTSRFMEQVQSIQKRTTKNGS